LQLSELHVADLAGIFVLSCAFTTKELTTNIDATINVAITIAAGTIQFFILFYLLSNFCFS
jgi:hypothetical protein